MICIVIYLSNFGSKMYKFLKNLQNYKKNTNIKSFFEKKFAKTDFFLYLCPKLAKEGQFLYKK